MELQDIIEAFEKVEQEDPKTFYNAMGFGDEGLNIMHPFLSGSYEVGLVAGALYALKHFTR